MKPCRSINQVALYVTRNASSACRSSSMVWKCLTHKRFSFKVRMNRSAQPFPSGARTKAGELSMPRNAISLLEVVRHVLRTVIVSNREAVRDVGREAAEVTAHALADRFQSLEACGSRMGMNADALGGTMIHRDEYRRQPFTGEGGGKVGDPHGVNGVRNDGAVMAAWASW